MSRGGFHCSRWVPALLLSAACLGCPPLRAATGGPDSLGVTWADEGDGCSLDLPVFTGNAQRWNDPPAAIGPLALGFSAPFARIDVVTEVWISPTGFLAFSDQGPDGASAMPQLLPDPAAPSHLVAPFWRPVPVRSLVAEVFPDRLEVEWQWDGGGPSGRESVWMTLHRDGRMRFLWGTSRFSNGDAAVGYENAGGAAGNAWWHNGAPQEPGFFQPVAGRSLCLTPPVLLECSDPVVAGCGGTAAVDLPASLPEQASVYSCAPGTWPGNEQTVRLDLPTPQQVHVEIDLPEADLFRVPLPPDCSEARCLDWGDQSLDFPVLFAGSHSLVVDKTTPGGGDRVTLDVTCTDLPEVTCGVPANGSTTGGSNTQTDYACAPVALDGPEAHVRITTATTENLSVTLPGAPPGLWLIIRDSAGNCLSAGEGGAAVFSAPAGTYVLTVDAEAGAASDFTLETACGTRLDCTDAPAAACGSVVAGNTASSPNERANLYACSSLVTDGAEDVYRFQNPREQLVAVRFLNAQPGQEAYLLRSCDEGDCVFGRLQGGCALLPAGDYHLVVDGPAGAEGEYELEIECRRISTTGVDVSVVALDTSGMPTDCRNLDVDGTLRVTLANEGDTDATVPFDLLAFIDNNFTANYEPATDVVLGTLTVTDPIPAGESIDVDVPVSGTLDFRDAVVYLKVDPGLALPDTNRTNEILSTGANCVVPAPPAQEIALSLEWEWTTSAIAPDFLDVESVPLVGDLDGDGLPEILAVGQECCGISSGAMIHALSGIGGTELWAADGPAERLEFATAPALGDLNADGIPEIVGQSFEDPTRLIALDNTGALLWTSEVLPAQSPFDTWGGTAAIADIDGDGMAEAIWGANAISADGTLFWIPEAGGTFGSADGGPQSTVADLDGDGLQEVVAGPTAYTWDEPSGMGRILWQNPEVPDGYPAVGEIDGDAGPEVLVAEHGRLHLLEGEDGTLVWTIDIPEGGGGSCGGLSGLRGGPPTLFDIDGDGRAEIGVMGADWFAVFDDDGSEIWRSPVIECSSGITSATAFDLNGDGELEIILKDQEALRILRGSDGTEITSVPGTSGTSREMPVVADIDADGQAEIVVVENRLLGGSGVGLVGVRAFGSALLPWRGARGVWNQHAYHVTNINEDLTVPLPTTIACAPPSPLAEGTFRVQRPRPLPGPLGPDITLTLLRAERTGITDCLQDIEITVRVGNGGGAPAGSGFDVAFLDESAGGALLALAAAIDLSPGQFTDLTETVSVAMDQPVAIRIAADDDGTGAGVLVQCREDNDECLVTDDDVTGVPIAGPADVGNAMRGAAHGPADVPDITATFDWSLDSGGPRVLGTGPGEEHYHLYRGILGGGPPDLVLIPGSEPILATDYQDTTPRTAPAGLPRVHGYRVVAADACERESED